VRFPSHRDLLPPGRAQHVGRLIGLCAIVGVMAGLGAVVFEALTGLLKHLLLDGLAGFRPDHAAGDHQLFSPTDTPPSRWILASLPIVGGLLGGAVVAWLAPEAEGHGTDAAIAAYHHDRGRIRARVPLVKTIASAITLGTGGSAGREGPIAQIGAGIGSLLAKRLRLTSRERRVLMIAGLAAGIGAIFRAPLASALFAAEVLYKEVDLEFEVLVTAAIASIVSYSVFTAVFGVGALFATPRFTFTNPLELLPYAMLALVVAFGAKLLVSGFDATRRAFERARLPAALKPALGGVVVGVISLVAPQALGSGYGLMQDAFNGNTPATTLLFIALFKIAATCFTIGSGQSGGVFGPAIVVGGLLGGAVGLFAQATMPMMSPEPGAFVVVGMAGFFAAAANTPLSTVIMVSEITGSYSLLVPTMWVAMITFLLVRKSTLYTSQLACRAESPVHSGVMMGEVLAKMHVGDACLLHDNQAVKVHSATSLPALAELFAETRHDSFVVVDDDGTIMGLIDDASLRQAVASQDPILEQAIVAADLVEEAPVLDPDDNLYEAMHAMVQSGFDELVVMAPGEELVGTLSRRDLIAAYDGHISRCERERNAPVSRVGSTVPPGTD